MWHDEEILYLNQLNKLCQQQSQRYKDIYFKYKNLQARMKIPVIVASSIAGLASFGTGTFPEGSAKTISMTVGAVNIIISIINAIEAFYQYQNIIEKSLKVSDELKKLSDEISLELSLNSEDREMPGVALCRKVYTEYESILQNSPPVLMRQRFIKPSYPLLEITKDTDSEVSVNKTVI